MAEEARQESFSPAEAAAIIKAYSDAALKNLIEAEELAVRASALRDAAISIMERANWVALAVRETEDHPEPDTGDNIAF